MPRAIDFHVHLPTEFMEITLGPYTRATERFFRTEVKLKDIEQIAAGYEELDMIGVLLLGEKVSSLTIDERNNASVSSSTI